MRYQRKKYADELIIESKKGIMRGIPVYGPFNPKTDKRCMIAEQQEETVDSFVYNGFDHQMRPDRHKFQARMNALYLAVYTALREEEEFRAKETTPKKGGGV